MVGILTDSDAPSETNSAITVNLLNKEMSIAGLSVSKRDSYWKTGVSFIHSDHGDIPVFSTLVT